MGGPIIGIEAYGRMGHGNWRPWVELQALGTMGGAIIGIGDHGWRINRDWRLWVEQS